MSYGCRDKTNNDKMNTKTKVNARNGGAQQPLAPSGLLGYERLKRLMLTNLALGRGFSDQEREAVERSSATQLRAALPQLLGLKRRQAPILDLLKGSKCGCLAQSHRPSGHTPATG